MAMEKRKIFSESRRLQEKVASLHAMLVDAIMQLAAFLLREKQGRADNLISIIEHLVLEPISRARSQH